MSNFPINSVESLSIFAKSLLLKIKAQEKNKSAIKSHNTFMSAIAEAIPGHNFNIHSLKKHLENDMPDNEPMFLSQQYLLDMAKTEIASRLEENINELSDIVYTISNDNGVTLYDFYDGTMGESPLLDCSNIIVKSDLDFLHIKIAVPRDCINDAFEEKKDNSLSNYVSLEKHNYQEAYKVFIDQALLSAITKITATFVSKANKGEIDNLVDERWKQLVKSDLSTLTFAEITA